MTAIGVLLAVVVVLILGSALRLTWWTRRRTGRHRVDQWLRPAAVAAVGVPASGRLGRWLLLAGYWGADASRAFRRAQAAALLAGGLIGAAIEGSGLAGWLAGMASNVPGAAGELMVAVLGATPWIIGTLVAAVPVLVVRAARRRIVRAVDVDLPLVFEILATLAEAGLGFDASLLRLLDHMPDDRPLHRALRVFHADVQAGVPRVQALRHLAERLDVGPVTLFVSALTQAEAVGASIAGTLRQQADDVRDRRRERVAMLGQVLPVKLMFPLVVCFLPGIFVTTLGPVVLQLVEVAGGFLRGR